MKVAVGCDPNASELKLTIIDLLKELGHEVKDFGSEDPIYPNVAFTVGESVASGEYERGILLCGTGIGMSIAANKVPGVYAALCSDAYSAERAIKSNNANVMALGAFTVGRELAKTMVKVWMDSRWETGTRSEPKYQAIVDYAEGKK
ncbi:MAG: RpiB/LacA/LacB family sugar-phosphate isomerase [Spirochaetales bacterium]|uniref:RpiB/LacA/LacB family sugar-phosphate isomerase n=1 Tax=Candidatus Thalassospirochaeta sargassi TaxID=3119039 RepID=A0AAJ1MJL6_9SPIO|nr:RpiB/LacA/LacB family sugar-phosphate isomerase [Spirochaetales bacterium]